MSLACRECIVFGAYDTKIVFNENGEFDQENFVGDYSNYFVCPSCAGFSDFEEVEESRFIIVQHPYKKDSWNAGNDSPKIKECQVKKISEEHLKERLPKIHASLIKSVV